MTRLFSVFGDSISTFEGLTPEGWLVFYEGEQKRLTGIKDPIDTWWGQVIKHYDGMLLANAAWSGCVLEGTEFPVGASEKRIAALEKDGVAPTDILIHIGINDYGWGSGEAQIKAGTPSAPPELAANHPQHGEVPLLAPADTVEKFQDSYIHMLQTMHKKWPEARLWATTLLPGRVTGQTRSTFPFMYRGVPFDNYNQAIKAACDEVENTYFCNTARFGFDYDSVDGTHPNARGMKQMAALTIAAMSEAQSANDIKPYEHADELTDIFKTTRFCDKPCVGCEHARGTGLNWWLVCEKQIKA